MGFLDRLLGRPPAPQHRERVRWDGGQNIRSAAAPTRSAATEDERAVARYRYLLRTAPPEQLEALHAEAFAALTPEQRRQVLQELATAAPEEAGSSTEPADLARAATRAEMRRPGTLQDTLGRGSFGGGRGGMGSMFAGSMMGTIAGVVVGSALANALFDGYDQSPEALATGDTGTDATDGSGADAGGDPGAGTGDDGSSGGGDGGGGDFGGGFGGGDFGGGDFGGGDFGGGDFGGF